MNISAAENNITGEAFNVGSGSRISVNALIEKMGEATGKNAKIKYIEKQKGDVRDTWADVSKAKEMLNWNTEVDINKGLKSFVEWFTSTFDKSV